MKKILFFLASVALLASCSNNEEMEGMVNSGSVQTFDVNVAPFVGDDGTRTNIGNGTNITWSAGDQLGVWPKQVAGGQLVQQLQFNIVGADVNKATAKFTGTGWGMITDGTYTYYANYPYATGAQPGEVEFSIKNGLSQNDLGKNDVAWAAPITPTAPEGVNFTFKHLGTLVKFVVTLPATTEGVQFSTLKLYSNENIFTKTITYNPAEAVAEGETPTLTATEKTNMLSVSLGNVIPQNNTISAYVLALPSELINKSFDVELISAENVAYIAHATALSNWNKGKLKTYEVTTATEGIKIGENLSVNANHETETANCYIISAAGAYNFLADVKGNGIVPTLEGLSTGDINENVAAIDLTGARVEVLWETVNSAESAPAIGTIIKSAKIYENRIVIETPNDFTEGNALISVKDASDNILWSWHIWATDAPQAQEYKDKDGNPVAPKMMDRNLGALANNSTTTTSYGFLYQWGRPFPIMYDEKTTNITDWTANATITSLTAGTLVYSRKNPTKFIYGSANNKDLQGTELENWYWGSLPLFWIPVQKTMYDPCPIGWRVPSNNTQWEKGFTTELTTRITEGTYINGRYITLDSSVFYPASGHRGNYPHAKSAECGNRNNYGLYWSCKVADTGCYAKPMLFNNSAISPVYTYNRILAFNVRPEKE